MDWASFYEDWGDLLFLFGGLLIGYSAGSFAELRHFRSIQRREKDVLHIPVVPSKMLDPTRQVDYFKRFLAGLRYLVGGRVGAYESLLDRARREAILRMKDQAKDADIIVNFRAETTSIGRNIEKKTSLGSIEVFAYGTAVTYQK